MIKAVLWDIGGVIVTDPKVDWFWGKKEGSKELRDEFGSGKLSTREFFSKGAKFLGISLSEIEKRYLEAYSSIELVEPVFEIYSKMRGDKYIVSDTNPIHSRIIKTKFSKVFNLAKKAFLSNEVNLRKRDSKFYEFVLNTIGIRAEEVLFIDNKLELLKVASSLGINTLLYKNPEDLRDKIEKLV